MIEIRKIGLFSLLVVGTLFVGTASATYHLPDTSYNDHFWQGSSTRRDNSFNVLTDSAICDVEKTPFSYKVTMFKRDWSKLFEGLYQECLSSFAAREGNLFRGGGRWRSTYLKMQFFREYQQRSFEKGIVHNEERNADIVKKVMERKQRQCLLITERIDHGNNLAAMFREAGLDDQCAQ